MTDSNPSTKHRAIKAVLFDLDGTLADTAPDMVDALNISLTQFGYSTVTLSQQRNVASHGSLAMVRAALPNANDDIQRQVQLALLENYEKVNGNNCDLFPGLWPFLSLLKLNDIPYGVVTNKPARFTRPLLIKLGLDKQMPAIVSGDSTLYSKPHTAPMLLAAQQIGVSCQHILYLGDAERDMVAARAANMQAGLAAWGYIAPNDDINAWPTDICFANSDELMKWFTLQLND
ncbi:MULTISPECIES: HAD family hydrolase [unclassified Shewanella]|uniref:HAD family hydrolase n=1 Tax=unclassified Shewanella TaxID=196818 RepID=UPI000C79B2E5|nr:MULTISPECIES: HAD-IA family hydrolase [unclassified Shewanella]PKG57356.1 HAD family hydrolase [Shewanella sp. GutDb-MelDb]PKG75299.1 HAD family hydrolase [Shewanella sp. GutCb]